MERGCQAPHPPITPKLIVAINLPYSVEHAKAGVLKGYSSAGVESLLKWARCGRIWYWESTSRSSATESCTGTGRVRAGYDMKGERASSF